MKPAAAAIAETDHKQNTQEYRRDMWDVGERTGYH
jgi:hypothetical protein